MVHLPLNQEKRDQSKPNDVAQCLNTGVPVPDDCQQRMEDLKKIMYGEVKLEQYLMWWLSAKFSLSSFLHGYQTQEIHNIFSTA